MPDRLTTFLRPRWVRSGSPVAYLLAMGAVTIATAIRFGIGIVFGPGIVPYATYFPAVLIVSVIAGGRSGMITAVLGGLTAYALFVMERAPDQVLAVISLALYLLSSGLIIVFAVAYRRSAQSLQREQERSDVLAQELRHRVRNIGALFQALIGQTFPRDDTRAETLRKRLAIFIATHAGVVENLGDRNIGEVIANETKLYGQKIIAGGPTLRVPHEQALCLTLAIHELATNAIKYGALSNPSGVVYLDWIKRNEKVELTWREVGGPPVVAPSADGFGSTLLKKVFDQCGGGITFDYKDDGLAARFALPMVH